MLFSRKKNKAPQKQINVIKVNGPCVVIKEIGLQSHLSCTDYDFLKQNINKPMRVFEVSWDRFGSPGYFAVYAGNSVVTIFVRGGAVFEFI